MESTAGTGIALDTPRFVEGRPMRLAGLAGRYTPETMRQIPALWERFAGMLDANAVPGQVGRVTYGVGFHCFDGSPMYEYRCAVEVTSFDGLPGELRPLDVPPLRWAVFTHREHVSRLGESIQAIWTRWFPASGLTADHRRGLPDFLERYAEEFDPTSGMDGMEVWFPVRR